MYFMCTFVFWAYMFCASIALAWYLFVSLDDIEARRKYEHNIRKYGFQGDR